MTTQTSDIHSVIHALVEHFESTFARGNAADIADFYTDNGMLLPTGSDFVKGKRAIEEYWQVAIDMGIKNIKEALIYVGETVSTRQKQAKKRSICLITEHFEPVFNAVMTTQVINQRFLKLDILEVEQHGDTAIEMSRYTLSNCDNHVMDQGKGVVIWKRDGGTWKLHRDIWNNSIAEQ